jgi:hypothetical protein
MSNSTSFNGSGQPSLLQIKLCPFFGNATDRCASVILGPEKLKSQPLGHMFEGKSIPAHWSLNPKASKPAELGA